MDNKENAIEIPISIKHNAFRNNIVKLINGSGLPGWAAEDILTNVLEELRKINANQLAQDQKQYEESLKAAKEAEEMPPVEEVVGEPVIEEEE